jgi:transcriptional regulator with XRE-family HTH domain
MANMRKIRKRMSLTQEKLAELCDTDPCYIRQIETGRRCPSLPYVEKIAAALGVAPYLLFYDETDGNILNDQPSLTRRELADVLISRVSETILEVVDKNRK